MPWHCKLLQPRMFWIYGVLLQISAAPEAVLEWAFSRSGLVKWRKAGESICDRNHALSAVGEIATRPREDECYGSFK